jgi:RimJ/RimL family protein N-acetyltransferase
VEIEVGYHIRGDQQGRGYATEAAGACRDYARGVLRLERLIAHRAARTSASRRRARG